MDFSKFYYSVKSPLGKQFYRNNSTHEKLQRSFLRSQKEWEATEQVPHEYSSLFYEVLCYLILALIYGKSWHKKVSFLQRDQIVRLQQTFTITELKRYFRLFLKGCVNHEKCSVQYNSYTYFLNDLHYESLMMIECCFCTLVCGNHMWKVWCWIIK